MQLITACENILNQLEEAVAQISPEDFRKPSLSLSLASVGQHVRHTLEFFICLESGFDAGLVNYDKRAHDTLIERDKAVALSTIGKIKEFITRHTQDKDMLLEVGYDRHDDRCVVIKTNYFRELTYNIEHAVHHMAIMKIGIREVASYVSIAPEFGVAVSTVRYKEGSAVAAG